jgi:mono/diheme cytochrome c family protein
MIGVSAADLWTRGQAVPVKVKSAAAALTLDEINKLMVSTPEQVAHGKELFAVNCAVCHGPEGKGDGAGGAALNPKPRNFHGPLSDWTNGDSVKAMYATLVFGVPGTGMASYKALASSDRIALIHFLHTWTPQVEAASKGDQKFAAALKEDGVGEGAGSAPKALLPIDFAIERITSQPN